MVWTRVTDDRNVDAESRVKLGSLSLRYYSWVLRGRIVVVESKKNSHVGGQRLRSTSPVLNNEHM